MKYTRTQYTSIEDRASIEVRGLVLNIGQCENVLQCELDVLWIIAMGWLPWQLVNSGLLCFYDYALLYLYLLRIGVSLL